MSRDSLQLDKLERWAIRFEGIVQGVGFRPLVSVCAHRYGLGGFVYNDGAGVYTEVQGSPEALADFVKAIEEELPRLAKINHKQIEVISIISETGGFVIKASPLDQDIHTFIPADTAPCQACLEEMKDGPERRRDYAFINCTHCGPRYSIIEAMPYDRARTTMWEFPMCPDCQEEYDDLEGRRYHAEPNACSACGPEYALYEAKERGAAHQADLAWTSDWLDDSEEFTARQDHSSVNAEWTEGLGASTAPPDESAEHPADSEVGAEEITHKGLHLDNLQCLLLGNEAIKEARQRVALGQILALKGIGGYHLVCDARQRDVVETLRLRKKRPHKPLALMAGSLEAAQAVAHISDKERALLESPARPIVLLRAKKETALPLDVIAPGTHYIGIMLPYAPIHEVLLPSNALWVMTSGNRSGNPVLFRDQEAQEDLLNMADAFLIHNRRIEAPVDDSVMTQSSQGPLLYRRSRGFVPEPIYVPSLKQSNLLAMGSDLKNAFAMNCGSQVLMGPHMGDLASPRSHEGLEWTLDHYQSLFNIKPEGLVIDLHPGYFSSQLGRRLGQEWQVPVLEVQHHHAHIAAVVAEHHCQEKVLGICFDGTGYGTDGSLWGGEFLVCQGGDFYRAAHLAPVPLWGGELAVKEPWRQALWYLTQTYGFSIADWPQAYRDWTKTLPAGWEFLLQASQSDMEFLQSSGAGRLFDAVGSLLGAGNVHSFDGQIAMSLEQMAMDEKGTLLDFHYEEGVLDLLPTVQALLESRAQGSSRKRLAATFHRTLAFAIAEVAESICDQYGIEQVVLAGGVFQNRRLIEEFTRLWDRKPVLMNHSVPPNDGGLALGQLYIAHQRWK